MPMITIDRNSGGDCHSSYLRYFFAIAEKMTKPTHPEDGKELYGCGACCVGVVGCR